MGEGHYGCSMNWNRGAKVCPNNARVRKSEVESVLLRDLKHELMEGNSLQRIAELANRKLMQLAERKPPRLKKLKDKQTVLQNEIQNIVRFVETGSVYSAALDRRLSEKEREIIQLENEMKDLSSQIDFAEIRIDTEYVSSWVFRLDQLLETDIIRARAELRNMMQDVSLLPITQDSAKYLRAKVNPNIVGLMAVAGGISKEFNSGGRI